MKLIYFIETSEFSTGECPANEGYIRATPSSETVPYTTSNAITITINGNAPATERNLVYTSWYFNGSSLPSGTSISSLQKLPTDITQTLRISNPTPLHAGTYEALLLLNSYSYMRQFACPDAYIYFRSRAGINRIILDRISTKLQYYGEWKYNIWNYSRVMYIV